MTRSFLMLLTAAALSSYCFADSEDPAESDIQVSESVQVENELSDPITETRFSSGMLIYRDPETGELGLPPPELMRGMQIDAMNFSDEGLEVKYLDDGSMMVELQGRFMMSSTVHQTADGVATHQCTSQPHVHLIKQSSGQKPAVREVR